MLIYPAIDLKDGVCVRLMHGKFDQVTRYDEQPATRLSAFAAEGAEWIHVVDLDGAEAGEAVQHALIGELTKAIDVKIESGGGVRSANDVAVGGDSGSGKTTLVSGLYRLFGAEHITLAFDVKIEDGVPVPALKGWTQSSGVDLWTALDRYPKGLFKHLLVTDVGRDGAMTGPNLELLAEIRRRRPDLVLQASGGVSSLDDIAAVKSLGCNGAIVGRALYENRFTLPDAIATAA